MSPQGTSSSAGGLRDQHLLTRTVFSDPHLRRTFLFRTEIMGNIRQKTSSAIFWLIRKPPHVQPVLQGSQVAQQFPFTLYREHSETVFVKIFLERFSLTRCFSWLYVEAVCICTGRCHIWNQTHGTVSLFSEKTMTSRLYCTAVVSSVTPLSTPPTKVQSLKSMCSSGNEGGWQVNPFSLW